VYPTLQVPAKSRAQSRVPTGSSAAATGQLGACPQRQTPAQHHAQLGHGLGGGAQQHQGHGIHHRSDLPSRGPTIPGRGRPYTQYVALGGESLYCQLQDSFDAVERYAAPVGVPSASRLLMSSLTSPYMLLSGHPAYTGTW